jgi:hypothetical protein
MLFSNKSLKINEKEYDWGKYSYVSLGEEGRGRREARVQVNGALNEIVRGDVCKYANGIGKTQKGMPKITREDGKFYAVLSSNGGYTRRGNGYVTLVTPELVTVLSEGEGADGDAGRIGSWTEQLLELREGAAVIVTFGGGYRSTLYVLRNGNLDAIEADDVYAYLDTTGIDLPIKVVDGMIRMERKPTAELNNYRGSIENGKYDFNIEFRFPIGTSSDEKDRVVHAVLQDKVVLNCGSIPRYCL